MLFVYILQLYISMFLGKYICFLWNHEFIHLETMCRFYLKNYSCFFPIFVGKYIESYGKINILYAF